MISQTIEVYCRRCGGEFNYPVLPEDKLVDVMKRIAIVHRSTQRDCARQFGASGVLIRHFDAQIPLFPVSSPKEGKAA